MDKTALTGRYEFEFYDGTSCEMTLAFILLKKLSCKNKDLYKRCQKVMTNGPEDELDMIATLYAAYVCANMNEENLLTEDEFTEKCGCDRFALKDAFETMTNPKKRKASVDRSN